MHHSSFAAIRNGRNFVETLDGPVVVHHDTEYVDSSDVKIVTTCIRAPQCCTRAVANALYTAQSYGSVKCVTLVSHPWCAIGMRLTPRKRDSLRFRSEDEKVCYACGKEGGVRRMKLHASVVFITALKYGVNVRTLHDASREHCLIAASGE